MKTQRDRKDEAAKGFIGFNATLGYKSERLKDLLDNVSPNEDILGLYHIEEHLPTVGTVVLYSCTLCNIKRTMHAIVVLAHVAGFKHRLNFLQCYYPDLLPHDSFPGPNSLHIKSLIRKILHLEKWSKDQIKSSTNSNPTENTDVKIIDKDFRTQLKEMAKQNEPLVGLHYITEHWSKNDPSEVPHYTCRICDVKLPQSSIIEHIIGNQHREIVVYTSFGSIVPVTAKKAERIAVLKTFCTKLEKKENDLFSYEIVYEDPEIFASSVPSNNKEPIKRPLPHDEMPEDEMLQDEMLRDEMLRDEMPRDEMPRDEMPRDEMLRGEMSRGEMSRGEMSRGEMTRNEIPRSERAWDRDMCSPPWKHPRMNSSRMPNEGFEDERMQGAFDRGLDEGPCLSLPPTPFDSSFPHRPHSPLNDFQQGSRNDRQFEYQDQQDFESRLSSKKRDDDRDHMDPIRRQSNVELLENLMTCQITNEEEACLALRASKFLTNALMKYRLKPVKDLNKIELGQDYPPDFPRDRPVDFPRDSPVDFPRDSPIDFPRDHQRDFSRDRQVDFPSDQQLDFPRERQQDFPRDHQRDFPRDRQRDSPRDRQRDSPRDHQRDSPRDRQQDSPRDRQWDSPRDRQRDFSRDRQLDFPSNRQQDSPRDREQGFPGDRQQGFPGDHQQGFPGDRQQGFPGDHQQGFPGERQQGLTGERQQGFPGDRQQGFPGDPQQGFPGERQQGFPGDLPPDFPKDLPPDFPRNPLPDFPRNPLPDFPRNPLPDLPRNLPTDFQGNLPLDFVRNLPPDFLRNLPLDFLRNLPPGLLKNLPPDFLKNLPPDFFRNVQPDTPRNLQPDFPRNLQPDFPRNLQPDFPRNLPPDFPINPPSDIPSNLPPDIPRNNAPYFLRNLPPDCLMNLPLNFLNNPGSNLAAAREANMLQQRMLLFSQNPMVRPVQPWGPPQINPARPRFPNLP